MYEQTTAEPYRQIFEATTDGLVVNDPDTGLVVEVNPAFCAMHGYEYAELIGAHPAMFIHPDDHPKFATFFEAFREGRPFTARARDVRRDGSVFDVEVHSASVLFRGRPHLLGVVRDVSAEADAYRLLEERVRQRTECVEALLAVTRMVAGTLDLDELGRISIEQARRVIDCDCACLYLRDGDSYDLVHAYCADRASVIERQRIPTLERALAGGIVILPGPGLELEAAEAGAAGLLDGGARALIVPLLARGRSIGFLSLNLPAGREVDGTVLDLAEGIADQVAMAAANARLHQAEREGAALQERHRIARDLHDSVSQTLFSTTMHARAAELAIDDTLPADHPLRRHVRDVGDLTRGALAEMRALIFELRPGALAEEGLAAALAKHVAAVTARCQVPVAIIAPDDRLPLTPEHEEELYRVTQEALANVAKHAGATRVEIRVTVVDGSVQVDIADDGCGFDGAERAGHLGLRTMRERMERAGGTLTITTAPGQGTVVRATIPAEGAG
jgi:PAS domain S-box-containing protein